MSISRRLKAIGYSVFEIIICVPLILLGWGMILVALPFALLVDRFTAWRERRNGRKG